ncbi:MAG TPA: hypothetical protein VIZ17_21110, partial [Acetobacteraceae bacterium]
MDEEVEREFHTLRERIKALEAKLKDETDERVQVAADLKNVDIEVTQIQKSLGGWDRGDFGKKVEDIDKRVS